MMSSLASFLVLALGVESSQALSGTFALQAGRSLTHAHMVATQIGPSPRRQRLDLWLTRDESEAVSRYDVEMTKYLHLIAISDDFATFMHVHPVLERDHHFRIDVRFPSEGLYHIYADDEPEGIGQQVFRYDLRVGSHVVHGRNLVPTGSRVSAGPYRVTLGATQLHTESENELAVHITKNRGPAKDLHPYLGAPAHAVFIDAADLTYAHVHPMPFGASAAMNGMSGPMGGMSGASPDMMLHVRVWRAGTYKLWLQFRGSEGLYVAPFVMTASASSLTLRAAAGQQR